MEPREEQLQRFKIATSILDLHVYNPDEDETMTENKSTIYEAPRSDGATDSGESKDDDDDGSNGAKSDRAGIERGQSDSAKSYGADNDGMLLQRQQTAVDTEADIKSVGKPQEPGTEQSERTAHTDAKSGEEEKEDEEQVTWPQLMILASGELEADILDY